MSSHIQIYNLAENVNFMKKTVQKIRDAVDGAYANAVAWECGQLIRDSIQIELEGQVYGIPEGTYARTRFLYHSIYLTTQGRTDRAAAYATAYAAAAARKSRSKTLGKTYYFSGHIPYNTPNSVRVTAGAQYAFWVEYGGGKGSPGPRPFMRDGTEFARRDIISYTKKEYARAMEVIASGGTPRFASSFD